MTINEQFGIHQFSSFCKKFQINIWKNTWS